MEYNTPTLPVKKSNEKSYRLVQDLRAVNKIMEDIYPVVTNPYTLLTKLNNNQKWFTVLDLRDAFFCLPLAKENQNLLSFKWKTLKQEEGHSSLGWCYLGDLKTFQPFLEINWHEN